ncbi:hypothetical protein MTYP_00044 [Methylophilaceae bacterium]|nr:hypothetical protein MTYP_00044 [Methylophilaceae bacterium]
MKTFPYSILLAVICAASPLIADEMPATVQATTTDGDQVMLHPNGRWEFVDSKKAAQAAAVAQKFPENQVCPPGSQGKFLGFGRCIPPGDKDFNRGSLSGKGR